MTTRMRVHFDGKVFIPDEPVDVPIGQPFEVSLRPVEPTSASGSLAAVADWLESLPPLNGNDSPTDLASQHDHYLYGTPKRP